MGLGGLPQDPTVHHGSLNMLWSPLFPVEWQLVGWITWQGSPLLKWKGNFWAHLRFCTSPSHQKNQSSLLHPTLGQTNSHSAYFRLFQEYFEYTPGVLRAYVKPKHLDALTFTLQPVIEALVLGWGLTSMISPWSKYPLEHRGTCCLQENKTLEFIWASTLGFVTLQYPFATVQGNHKSSKRCFHSHILSPFSVQLPGQTRMACKYIWGEVKELDGEQKTATYKPIFTSERDRVNREWRWFERIKMMMRVPRLT